MLIAASFSVAAALGDPVPRASNAHRTQHTAHKHGPVVSNLVRAHGPLVLQSRASALGELPEPLY